ncbi:MAG: 5-oxoprolinase subunit PxpA, partial [Vulcanimicrobiaceae bacterium]
MAIAVGTIDINSDMGESYGHYTMGDDVALLDVVTTANVACGFHGGDPEVMAKTMSAAKERGVAVGAHPGFPDLWGFGRRRLPYTADEIVRFVAYQIGAAAAMATLVGHKLTSVKAHGALGNMAAEELEIASAVAKAAKAVDPNLALLVMSGTQLERAADKTGLRPIYEIYADRAYT